MALMPWKETDPVKQRVKFLLEWEKRWYAGDGRTNFAALCREFGISRQVGYDLVARYRKAQHDVSVAAERSRRPHTSPTKVALELEDFIVSARKQHPTWGPKKLRGVDSAPPSGAAASGAEHGRRHPPPPRHDARAATEASEQ